MLQFSSNHILEGIQNILIEHQRQQFDMTYYHIAHAALKQEKQTSNGSQVAQITRMEFASGLHHDHEFSTKSSN